MTLADYLDAAKHRQAIASDRQLGARLGLKSAAISSFRTGKSLPSDATMRRVAEMAGRDARIALLELALWRSEDAATSAVYADCLERLKRSIKRAAVALPLLFSLGTAPDRAEAAPRAASPHTQAVVSYVKLLGALKRLLRLRLEVAPA